MPQFNSFNFRRLDVGRVTLLEIRSMIIAAAPDGRAGLARGSLVYFTLLDFVLFRTDGPCGWSVRTVRTDRPYGPSGRTVRTDRPYGRSVRTVRTDRPYGRSVRTVGIPPPPYGGGGIPTKHSDRYIVGELAT